LVFVSFWGGFATLPQNYTATKAQLSKALYVDKMKDFENQVKVSSELSELLDYAQIYCSASCCGLGAFEIHKSLLLRKVINKKLAGESGIKWYGQLKVEIESLHELVSRLELPDEYEIPIVYPTNDTLPEFYLPKNELQHLLLRWQRVFRQVKGTQAVP
jgi:hypothetical protein